MAIDSSKVVRSLSKQNAIGVNVKGYVNLWQPARRRGKTFQATYCVPVLLG